MTIIFDGRALAHKKEKILAEKVSKLPRPPKLVTILANNNQASSQYVNMKKKAGERIGIEVEIKHSLQSIESLNQDPGVDGIMIQLPINEVEYIQKINRQKDVDGMREDSPYLPATIKGILEILQQAQVTKEMIIGIVGAKGQVGRRLAKVLGQTNRLLELDQEDNLKQLLDADVVISATGVPKIINANVVKEGAIVIDVGAPTAEVDFENVSKKASFITPVPGGVGPMTIVSLMENVVEAASLASSE